MDSGCSPTENENPTAHSLQIGGALFAPLEFVFGYSLTGNENTRAHTLETGGVLFVIGEKFINHIWELLYVGIVI